jgi:hypothetical protein
MDKTATPLASEKTKLRDTLAPMYRGSKNYDETGTRGGTIARLTNTEQLMILDDKDLGTMKDSNGLTPVHDIARSGSEVAQNKILDNSKLFDGPDFRSELGTPLDILAMNGKVEVQLRMVKLPIQELTAIRTIETHGGTMKRQTTLLHELASDSFNSSVVSEILKLPKDVLMKRVNLDDPDSESVLQLIVSGGGSKAAKDLAKSLKQQS